MLLLYILKSRCVEHLLQLLQRIGLHFPIVLIVSDIDLKQRHSPSIRSLGV